MKKACNTQRRALWAGVVGLLLLVPVSGCGSRLQVADPVDPDLARRTLRDALDAWNSGLRPEDLQQKSPKVIVQDFDWMAGNRLVSYEVKAQDAPQDANLFCEVKLVLEDRSRKKIERSVTYCVGTDPVLTVFRTMGP